MNASRCQECGSLAPLATCPATACTDCGALLPQYRSQEAALPPGSTVSNPITKPASLVLTSEDHRSPYAPVATAPPATDGRVLIVEPVIHEPADFDPFRVITRGLWMLMILTAPFVLGWTALVTIGGFSALLVIAGCVWLLMWFTPSNLLSALHFLALFRGSHRRDSDQVPVRYFRLREPNDTEVVVRINGALTRGNIGAGDRVACYGTWRDGVLMMQRAFNHTSRSSVELVRSMWPTAFVITLLVLFIGGLSLFAASQSFLHSLDANFNSTTLRY